MTSRSWVAIFAVGVQLVAVSQGRGEAVPPNGVLQIAYRQLTQRKPSESVHQLTLECWDGGCSITTLTLNQCMESSAGLAFYPKVQRSSTVEGDLKIVAVASGTAELEQELGGTRFLYRFTYSEEDDPARARRLNLRTSRFFVSLTGFSGSVIKSSAVLGKVISWDLVPLKGRSAFIEAKCKIMLDGLPER